MKAVKSILFVIMYLIIYYTLQFSISFTLSIIFSSFMMTDNYDYMSMRLYEYQMGNIICMSLICSAIVAFIVFFAISSKRKEDFFEVCNFKGLSLKIIPFLIILAISVNVSGIFLLDKLDTTLFTNNINTFSMIDNSDLFILVLTVAIVVPFIEEIMFRGLIFKELNTFLPVLPTIIIQGILFGVYHLNFVQMIYAGMLGLIYGFVYIWTKSIWSTIILHMINNFIVIILVRFLVDIDFKLFVLGIALAFISLFCIYRKRIVLEEINYN